MGESLVGSPLWPLTERATHKQERKRARVMSHYSDTIKHCNNFAVWEDCDKHKDLECYRLECVVCDWKERDCEEDK